jgi:hypothetical protein
MMPEASGTYANRIDKGLPRWEDYHIGKLIPCMDSHIRTVAGRRGRALAGMSAGGTAVAGVGTTYHQIRKTDEQDLRITQLEWNHSVAVQTEAGLDESLSLASLALHDTLPYEPSSAHSVAYLSTPQRYQAKPDARSQFAHAAADLLMDDSG